MRTRRGSRTPNNDGLSAAPLPLGYPGMVDQVGFEPTTSCLQDRRSTNWSYRPVEPATRIERAASRVRSGRTTFSASPAWSQRRESNPRRPLTRRLHVHRAALASVPSAGFEPAPATSSTSCLYRWATRASCSRGHRPGSVRQLGVHPWPTCLRALPVAPSHGFEPRFRRSERRVLPLDDEGMRPPGVMARRPFSARRATPRRGPPA